MAKKIPFHIKVDEMRQPKLPNSKTPADYRELVWKDQLGIVRTVRVYNNDIDSPFTFKKACLIAAALGCRTCGEVDKFIEFNAGVIFTSSEMARKLGEYRASSSLSQHRFGFDQEHSEGRWDRHPIYVQFLEELWSSSDLYDAARGVLPGMKVHSHPACKEVGCIKRKTHVCAWPECYSYLVGTLGDCPEAACEARAAADSHTIDAEERLGRSIETAHDLGEPELHTGVVGSKTLKNKPTETEISPSPEAKAFMDAHIAAAGGEVDGQ